MLLNIDRYVGISVYYMHNKYRNLHNKNWNDINKRLFFPSIYPICAQTLIDKSSFLNTGLVILYLMPLSLSIEIFFFTIFSRYNFCIYCEAVSKYIKKLYKKIYNVSSSRKLNRSMFDSESERSVFFGYKILQKKIHFDFDEFFGAVSIFYPNN